MTRKAIKNGIAVRRLGPLVAKLNGKEKRPKKKTTRKSTFIRASESQSTGKFGTGINITESKKGDSHLAINLTSTDGLDRALGLLGINLGK